MPHHEDYTEEKDTERNETEAPDAEGLTDEELDKASGGAFPTAVNNQVTDSIT